MLFPSVIAKVNHDIITAAGATLTSPSKSSITSYSFRKINTILAKERGVSNNITLE